MDVRKFAGASSDWNKFLAENKGGILASYEWGDFRLNQGWRVYRLQVTDGKTVRAQASVLARPLPAGHCFYYSPESPIVRKGDWHDPKNQQAVAALRDYLHEQSRQDKALFLKIDPHVAKEDFPADWLRAAGFRRAYENIQAPFVAHVDLTPSEADIMANMRQRGRRNIRKAEKAGVTITTGCEMDDVENFFKLHEITANRQYITYRSKKYFAGLCKYLSGSGKATCFTGWYEGKAVASIMVTFFGDEAIYLYGGSDIEDHNVYASYLLQWEAMKEAKKRGCKFYNMTGVAPTDDPNDKWAGLRQFKLSFGAEVVGLIGAHDNVYRPLRYQLFSQADRVRRKLAKRFQT